MASENQWLTLQLSQEFEWILGGEGEKGGAHEQQNSTCSKVLKQGELEAANNSKLSKAIADLPEGISQFHVSLSECYRPDATVLVCVGVTVHGSWILEFSISISPLPAL